MIVDLVYHERCRSAASILGLTLKGSSFNAGFTTVEGHEVPHVCMLWILAVERERLIYREALVELSNSPHGRYCQPTDPVELKAWNALQAGYEARKPAAEGSHAS